MEWKMQVIVEGDCISTAALGHATKVIGELGS